MKTFLKSLLLGAAGLAACLGPVGAADLYDLPPIYQDYPEIVPVEVGSGWYLRGDVSYNLLESDLDVDYSVYNGLFSYRDSYDGASLERGFGFGGGVGYHFSDFFRGDVTATYWKADVSDDSGLEGVDYGAELEAWEVMANAYVDLGTIVGVTPYLGAGIGAVHTSYETECSIDGIDCDSLFGVETSGSSDWRLAYSLMVGASYDLTRNLKIDVGYEYLDVDGGDLLSVEGPGLTGVNVTEDGFDRHTIQAGIRYSIF